MKLKIWVEVFTTERYAESVIEVPDSEWEAMTPEEREAYKQEVFENALYEVANGGCEETED